MWSSSFPPLVKHDTQVLVLGSMPGQQSLLQQQYYAHPANIFWRLMQNLFDIPVNATYAERLSLLYANKIGLWDVYARCYRKGSLDSAIATGTAQYNDFNELFMVYPEIHSVFFNGKAAEKAFRQHIVTNEIEKGRYFKALPSTSPANASIPASEKYRAWQQIKEVIKHVE